MTRTAMRVSRYNASDTYYPQTLSMLRLDRPAHQMNPDPALEPLEEILPNEDRHDAGTPEDLMALAQRYRSAVAAGHEDAAARIRQRIAELAATPPGVEVPVRPQRPERSDDFQDDVLKAVRESLAFRTTVHTEPAIQIAERGQAASALLADENRSLIANLGLRDLEIVQDLPVISAAFGYTRRAFQPTYEELGTSGLPTEIRAFPPLDQVAAQQLQRADLVGQTPILAREGEHEGLFLSLDQARVVRWLAANGVELPESAENTLVSVLRLMEPVDRYYDDVWTCRVRRLVFGLVHSVSHAAMRAASRLAGIERTSIGEYVFLPLLGSVIYDNASVFQLGGFRTMARDHLATFLEALQDNAVACLYDPDCIDKAGACHGCIHSPEICCRFFNHGLSRSFLLGGQAPWVTGRSETLVGYWEL